MSRQIDLVIDLYKEHLVPIKLKQDDTTVLNFNITENGVLKDLTGCNFELRLKKPDNTLVTQTEGISISNGVVSIQLIDDCLRVAGESKAELRILKDNVVISTYIFTIIIGISLANITPSGNVATLVNQLNEAISTGLVTKQQLDAWVGAHSDIVNLDSRVKQNTSQLADISTNVSTNSTQINSLSTKKADKDYLDIKIASVSSGAPKGVFNSLSELQNNIEANSSEGKKSIYIVGADWYYWNGSIWQSGGVYQERKISEGSVSYSNTNTNLRNNVFKFDKRLYTNNITVGMYQNTTLSTDNTFKTYKLDASTYDAIKIKAIISQYTNYYTKLDSQNNIISYEYNANGEVNYESVIDVSDCHYLSINVYQNKPIPEFYSYSLNTFTGVNELKNDLLSLFEFNNEVSDCEELKGYYSNGSFISDVSFLTKKYKITNLSKIKIDGYFSKWVDIADVFDGDGNYVKSLIPKQDIDGLEIHEVLDVSNFSYIALSNKNGNSFTLKSLSVIDNTELINLDVDHVVHGKYYQNTEVKVGSNYSIVYYDVSDIDNIYINFSQFDAYTNKYTLLDDNNNIISYEINNSSSYGFLDSWIDTKLASKLALSCYMLNVGKINVQALKPKIDKFNSYWYGKKIVWFGTSIPAAGYKGNETEFNYPKMVGKLLGATVYNEAVGSSTAHCQRKDLVSASNPYGFGENFDSVSRCLSNSLQEMQWIIDNWNSSIFKTNPPQSMNDTLKADILSFSYENKLDKYLGDGKRVDLYVFDHGYNDWILNESDFDENDPYNKKTFKGAMNFLIARILSDNPYARIIIMTHNNNQNLQGYNQGLIQAQESIADDWQLPCCQLYKRLGWSSKRQIPTTKIWDNSGYLIEGDGTKRQSTIFNLWIYDGIHPHTDRSNRALKYVANNIASWLNSEVRKVDFD